MDSVRTECLYLKFLLERIASSVSTKQRHWSKLYVFFQRIVCWHVALMQNLWVVIRQFYYFLSHSLYRLVSAWITVLLINVYLWGSHLIIVTHLISKKLWVWPSLELFYNLWSGVLSMKLYFGVVLEEKFITCNDFFWFYGWPFYLLFAHVWDFCYHSYKNLRQSKQYAASVSLLLSITIHTIS